MIESQGVSSASKQAETPPNRPPWHWPPRPFTFVVVGLVLAIAFVICFPAIEVPHADLRAGTFGLHFNLVTEYEHGWPAPYARRELAHRTSAQGPPSAWRPWEGPGQWSMVNLLFDLGLWGLVLVGAGVAAEYIAWGFSAAGPSGTEGPTFRPFLSAAPPVWRCVSFCSFFWG